MGPTFLQSLLHVFIGAADLLYLYSVLRFGCQLHNDEIRAPQITLCNYDYADHVWRGVLPATATLTTPATLINAFSLHTS